MFIASPYARALSALCCVALCGCPASSGVDGGGHPQLFARVERVVATGLPEPSVDISGLLRVLDDGRVVSPVDVGSGAIGALRIRNVDGTVTPFALPAQEAGGQFSFFEDEKNFGGWHDSPARGWAVLDGTLHEYVGAGGRPRGRLTDGSVLIEIPGAIRGQVRLARWHFTSDGGQDLVDATSSFAELSFTRFGRLSRNGTIFYLGRGGANGEQGEPTVIRTFADGGSEVIDVHPPVFSFSGPNDGLVEPACCQVVDVDSTNGAMLGLLEGRPIIRTGNDVQVIDEQRAQVHRLNARGDVLYQTTEPLLRFDGQIWRFDPSLDWGSYFRELSATWPLQTVDMNALGQILVRPTNSSAYLLTPSLTQVPVPADVLSFVLVSGSLAVPEPMNLNEAQVSFTLTSSSLSLVASATTPAGKRRVLSILVNGADVRAGSTIRLKPSAGQGTVSIGYSDQDVGLTAVGNGNGSIEVVSVSPATAKLVDVELSSVGAIVRVSGPVSQR